MEDSYFRKKMISTKEIKIKSDGTKNSFFIKKGYESQERNNTLNANRSSNYWDFGRIINSAWDQADCYRYAQEYVLNNFKDVLEIGCGTLVKQNKFFFEKGKRGKFYCIDQEAAFQTAAQIVPILKNIQPIVVDLEQNLDDLIKHLKSPDVNLKTILCFDVIEHLYNPCELLRMIKEVAKKDTEIIISTPERDLKRGKDCMGSNKPEHVREWNQKEFAKLLESFEFEIKDIQIMNDTDAKENCKETMLFRINIR